MPGSFISSTFTTFFIGLRDSFLGAVALFSIDKAPSNEETLTKDDDSQLTRPPGRRGPRPRRSKEEPKILSMLMQCCFLNGGVFLLSVVMFENYLIPVAKYLAQKIFMILTSRSSNDNRVWLLIEPIMAYTFGSLWVIPLFWLSKILNSIWFLEIADVAYRRKHGRPLTSILASRTDSVFKYLSKMMSDFLFSIVIEIIFLFQANLIGLVPVIGPPFAFLHLSLLYSLYAFEYTWMNLGWGVVKRISYVENHWPYFLGFGFLLAVLSTSSSTVISACLFGVLFPLFILSGLEAKPSEDCGYPIKVFSMAIWLTNNLFLRSKTRRAAASKSSVNAAVGDEDQVRS
ncbi:etoposide-induced protein 2.4 homolog [Rhopilema esculentum]|uniref:etoposide-induced protein 2.4 homolog n=1 Tax=Rhopilema esculentum TaxID=499914 RepID=UPI0031CF5457